MKDKDVTITVKGQRVTLSMEEAKDIFFQLRPTVLADAVRVAVEDEGEYRGLSEEEIRKCADDLAEDIECILEGYFDDAVDDAVRCYA